MKVAGHLNGKTMRALAIAVGSLAISRQLLATTHTWNSADGSWGDAAKWSSASANPPNTNSADAFIGNGGTVSLATGSFLTDEITVGHSGTSFPGTGALIIDSGLLNADGTIVIGNGNAGTLLINGGTLTVLNNNRILVGGGTFGTGSAFISITSGTFLTAKTGIESGGAGASTLTMSGGTLDFSANNVSTNQVAVGKFIFSGGFINNFAGATIHELSGDGSISVRTNASNLGVTIDQSIDTVFNGSILGQSSGGKFIKTGPGSLELGGSASITLNASINFNGGTVKVNRNQAFGAGSLAFAGGTLDLNGFTETGSFLTGSGTIKLGNGGALTISLGGTGIGTFDGLITGAGAFAKANSGTLVLSGSQAYTGNTLVSGGTLSLTNTSSNPLAGSPSVSISSSGNVVVSATGLTLAASQLLTANGRVSGNVTAPAGTTARGSGTFSDSLTVNGTIGTTGNVGTLTAGTLTLNSASVNVELGSAGADRIVVSNPNALSLNGTSTITLTDLGGIGAGTFTVIDYNGTALADLGHLVLSSSTIGSLNAALVYNSANTSIDLSLTSTTVNGIWNFNGDGNWSESAKWDGGVPNGVDHTANLGTHGGSITVSPTVTLDTDITVGSINFDLPTGGYTIAATVPNKLTLDVSSGSVSVSVSSGSHVISAPVLLNDDANINVGASSSLSFTGAVTATGRNITKSGDGFLQMENARAAGLTVSGGSLRISAKGSTNNAAGTSVVSSLSIAGGSSIDLTNNAMIVNYSTLGSLLSDTRQQLADGRLTTSLSAGGHALGYADNAVLGKSTFGGQSVVSSAVLIGYTFSGDANLDGVVNALDFNALASNFGAADGVWTRADFNYDANVNSLDFTAIAMNFGQSLVAAPSATGLGSLVPEPMSGGLFVSAMLLARRRRR